MTTAQSAELTSRQAAAQGAQEFDSSVPVLASAPLPPTLETEALRGSRISSICGWWQRLALARTVGTAAGSGQGAVAELSP